MKFTRTSIPDVILIDPIIHSDERGYFVETFREDKLEAFLGHKIHFCQDNESKSSFGVMRGLHYQMAPKAQSKILRVASGEILDVVVDIRKGSPTFGQHVKTVISAENKRQIFVPRGFAHGFLVLSETCIFNYKVDNFYSAECDRGIAFNDPALGIDWTLDSSKLQLSPKDLKHPTFSRAEYFDFKVNLYE